MTDAKELLQLGESLGKLEHESEQFYTDFVRDYFRQHVPAENLGVMLAVAPDFARKLREVISKQAVH